MQCTECQKEVSENARYCGGCGKAFTTSTRCRKCHHPRNEDPFCENCGLHHATEYEDDSFLELVGKQLLGSLRIFGFTHLFIEALAPRLGFKKEGRAGEELAYVVGLSLTYCILSVNAFFIFGTRAFVLALIPYGAYRVLDIISYELKIVFLDRHQDMAKAGGHLLSVDRRVMLLFIHLLDLIGCYAILYLGVVSVQAQCAFTAPSLKSSVEAVYFSVVVASFTGLSAVTPTSDWARLTVVSEVLLNLVLLTILFSTVVGSLGELTEITPRPPKAPPRFHRLRFFWRQGVTSNDLRDDDGAKPR